MSMTRQNVIRPKSTHRHPLDPKAVDMWQSLMTVLRQLVPADTHHQGYSVDIEDGEYQMIVGWFTPNKPDVVQNEASKENWYSRVIEHLAGHSRYPGPLLVRGPLAVTQYKSDPHGDFVPVTMEMHIDDVSRRLDWLGDFWKQQYNVSLQYNIRIRYPKPAKLYMSITPAVP